MNYLIFGASCKLATELMKKIYSKDKDPFFLLSSSSSENLLKLKKHAVELKYNYKVFLLDFNNLNESKLDDLKNNELNNTQYFQNIYFFSAFTNLEVGQVSNEYLKKSLNINCLSMMKLVNYFLHIIKENTLTINFTSSIAVERPRKINYIYAGSKLMFENYLLSLSHYFQYKRPYIKIYRLGWIKSEKLDKFFAVSHTEVANYIFKNEKKNNEGIFYYPLKWRVLAYVIRYIPKFIFKKIKT